MNRNRAGARARTGLFFVGFGVLLALIALGVFGTQAYDRLTYEETDGRIERVSGEVDRIPEGRYGADDSNVYIRYEYSYNGKTYDDTRVYPGVGILDTVEDGEAAYLLEKYKEGQLTTVYVDPSNPDEAYIEKSWRVGQTPILFGAGLMAIVGGSKRYVSAKRWVEENVNDD